MIRIAITVSIFTVHFVAAFAQGSVVLVGGGSENYSDWSDAPYRWLVTHAANRKIAVLHYADTSTFFTGYFPWLSPCSVSNLAITSVAQANDSATYRFILQHDGIFLRGGDQALYVSNWRGTLTEQAITEVFQRGGAVGGTSAGEMVLTEVSFTGGTTNPWTILRTPTTSMTLVDTFLGFVPNTLAESHTSERGRLGRIPVFLARYHASTGRTITGIAVDANTAMVIGPDGVGEVMGGNAVTILRWNADTRYVVEAGKPFALADMSFDQILPGWKIDLNSGAITVPSSAIAFQPKAISFPTGPVLLDGSGNSSDWIAAGGSLRSLQLMLSNQTDAVSIISSPSNPVSASAINSALTTWGMPSRVLLINEARKDDPAFASLISSSSAFVFVGNSPDSLARLLAPTTASGAAFVARVEQGIPTAFLSEDAMLAGEQAISGLYTSPYSAYYGTISQLPGLNLLKGMQIIPRFYQNANNAAGYDYSENRSMGMHWSMGQSRLPYGLLIDAGAHVIIAHDSIAVRGVLANSTPAILVDGRNAAWTDFPVFHRPGKPNAVKNGALVGARLHILRTGETSALSDVLFEDPFVPQGFRLEQNFPNPFNPETVISYQLSVISKTNLQVYDVLGREIKTLVNTVQQPGNYRVTFEASGLPSGTYLYRLTADGVVLTRNMILLK
jgi:cyanophycinase